MVSVFQKAAILATKSAINLKPSAGAEFKALRDLLSWKGSSDLVCPQAGRQWPAAILQSLSLRSHTLQWTHQAVKSDQPVSSLSWLGHYKMLHGGRGEGGQNHPHLMATGRRNRTYNMSASREGCNKWQ